MQGLLQWYQSVVDMGRIGRLEARLERISLRRAAVATVESAFGVKWLRDHYPLLEVHQAEHAPSWVFHQVQRRPSRKPVQFLFVGSLSRIKGTDLLLKALDNLLSEMDFRLTIVGSASAGFLSGLKACASPRLWERITHRMELTQLEVSEELGRATIVLFPSLADNSPNSVKEAVVAGVPVVASAVGGIPDYVLPGRNGLLFAPGDLDEFARAIRAAVAHPLFGAGNVDMETLNQMRQYLSPALMGEKFRTAYSRVLETSKTA
jgi:glycosyltransferase involved in cell wall biosynthesis